MSIRVMQHNYIAPDGTVYDSKDEYLYLQILLTDKRVTCIHRQVKLNIFHTLYMIVPKQLKTKIRYDKRVMVNGHSYKADFVFLEDGRLIVCDVKSSYTHKLREFRITAKGVINKILSHNKKRHFGEPYVVFREAIHIKKDKWKLIDYPPKGCTYYDEARKH